MIRPEALALLALADGAPTGAVREAYLRRVVGLHVDDDPDTFMRLREAFELLTHGAGATPEEVAAARAAVATAPDDAGARWRLLAFLGYGAGPEASAVLRAGAERQPQLFLDELMFHFPERVPVELLHGARDGAGAGRLFLIADVEATEGRPAEALEALRAALAAVGTLTSSALLRLALRPIFSLHVHGQLLPAREALGLVQPNAGASAIQEASHDLQAATTFRVAVELGSLDETFPLDLRQVAARSAKRGDFQNAPYEAKYATRLLKPREVPRLNAQLKRNAPTMACILGLELTDDQLRPAGTPVFLRPYAWGTAVVVSALYLSFRVHLIERRHRADEAVFRDVATSFVSDSLGEIARGVARDCTNPDTEKCHAWHNLFSTDSVGKDAGGAPDQARGPGQLPVSPDDQPFGPDGQLKLPIIGNHDKRAPRRRPSESKP